MSNQKNKDFFVQKCRQNYDQGKLQQKNNELETTLALKNKENLILIAQNTALKQQHAIRIAQLEKQIRDHQKETAQVRYQVVRSKRSESQKNKKWIEEIKREHQIRIKQLQVIFEREKLQIKERNQQQIARLNAKHQHAIKCHKKEAENIKAVQEQKSSTNLVLLTKVQQENSRLLSQNRQKEQRCILMTRNSEQLRNQYQQKFQQKDAQILKLRGQIEGGKMQQTMLREELQQQKQRRRQTNGIKDEDLYQIKFNFQQITKQNDKLKQLIAKKDQQILRQLGQINSKTNRNRQISMTYDCNHLPLINQYERALEMQQTQLNELRSKLSQWSQSIGFSKPVSQRMQQIAAKSRQVKVLNDSFGRSLKQKNR